MSATLQYFHRVPDSSLAERFNRKGSENRPFVGLACSRWPSPLMIPKRIKLTPHFTPLSPSPLLKQPNSDPHSQCLNLLSSRLLTPSQLTRSPTTRGSYLNLRNRRVIPSLYRRLPILHISPLSISQTPPCRCRPRHPHLQWATHP